MSTNSKKPSPFGTYHAEPEYRPRRDPRLSTWSIATLITAITLLLTIVLLLQGCDPSGITDDAGAVDASADTEASIDAGAADVQEVQPDGHSKSDALAASDLGGGLDSVGVPPVGEAGSCPTFGNCQVDLCAPATFTATPCPADRTFALCWFNEGTPNGSRLQQWGCNPSTGVTCVASCEGGPPAP